MEEKQCSAEKSSTKDKKGKTFAVGSRVLASLGNMSTLLRGTVRYIGHITPKSGELVGVELDVKTRKATRGNYYQGKQKVFDCSPHKGIIVRPSQVMKEEDFSPDSGKGPSRDGNYDDNPADLQQLSGVSYITEPVTEPVTEPEPVPSFTVPEIPKEVALLCECPVCFNIFHNPKSLHCEHHFCEDCLGELVKFDNQIPSIKCPTCNSIHMFGGEDIMLSSLKCQLFLKQILDTYSGSMKVVEGPRCCNQPVHWYCGDRRQFMCDKCFNDLNGQTGKNTTAVRYCRSKESMLPYCTVHEMFQYQGCTTCACTLCPYCFAKQHRDHLVLPLVEYAERFKGYLSNTINATEDYRSKLLESSLLDESNGAQQAIIKRANDIRTMVHSVEERLLKKAELLRQMERSRLEEKLRENLEILEKAEVVQKQGNVGIIWGTPMLVEAAPRVVAAGLHTVSESASTEVVDAELNGAEKEQALLSSVCNYFQGIHYLCMDESGSATERKMNVTFAELT